MGVVGHDVDLDVVIVVSALLDKLGQLLQTLTLTVYGVTLLTAVPKSSVSGLGEAIEGRGAIVEVASDLHHDVEGLTAVDGADANDLTIAAIDRRSLENCKNGDHFYFRTRLIQYCR